MIPKDPVSSRAKWGVVLAVAVAHPVLLFVLYPLLKDSGNMLVLAAPVVATLLLGIRIGAIFVLINAGVSGFALHELSGQSFREGMPKAVISILVTAVVCIGADRLRRFIEQRKSFEAALRQAQKMEAVGRLAGGVAHDINNTLNAIMGSAFALRHELTAIGHSFPDLDNIAVACDRGAQLTRNLLGFARKGCHEEQPFSLNAVVKTVLALLSRTAHKSLRFETRLSEVPPIIIGDQGQLEHAVMNLCLNAIDAMENSGTLTIVTRMGEERAFISVSDTGSGMDEHVREHAFEPFFTTKPVGRGTGMGLSMVYGTVQSMHGDIAVDTKLGRGTTFTLTFPRGSGEVDEKASPSASFEIEDPSILSGRTVLLVDDEPLVLRAGLRMLQTLGCKVLTAKCGREAMEVFTARKDVIALVIVDFIMPEGDGTTILEDILALAPRTPVLLASGYALDANKLEAILQNRPKVAFLAKPYEAHQLLTAARKLLPLNDGAPSSRTGTA